MVLIPAMMAPAPREPPRSADSRFKDALFKNTGILSLVVAAGVGLFELGERIAISNEALAGSVPKTTYEQNRQTDSIQRVYFAAAVADDTKVHEARLAVVEARLDSVVRLLRLYVCKPGTACP